mgnify:CR=1 FL=1|tara:strand:- start:2949 stop:3617 length:669 start_codon:yes stop_codon:yes gene_type:complete
MIYNKDYRDIIKDLDKDKTLIITDPPYNIGWKYDTYKDKISEDDYLKMFSYFKGFRFVVIHYIEDIIKYIVPTMGVPTKVVQWVYNSHLAKQHRSIAFFNCKPDFSKVLQPHKNLKDKRILKDIANGKLGCRIYDWWNIDIINNNSKEKEDYSNQIPEKVISNIIKIVANENNIIFDPFMGSGTTPAVASKLGYKYIGTDISKKAYNITKNRLSKTENNLFA